MSKTTSTPAQAGNGIRLNSLQETLDSGRDAARKGQQQFFTPPGFASAFMRPMRRAGHAVDFQMGAGALLLGSQADELMGVDIDKSCARQPTLAEGFWSAYQADITLLAPILHEIGWKADCFTLNPPFSIQFEAARLAFLAQSTSPEIRNHYALGSKGGAINSGLATLLLALELCSLKGEGYIVLSDTIARKYLGDPASQDPELVLRHPCRRHLWLWLSIPGSIFEGVNSIDTAVLYFARDHRRSGPHHLRAELNTVSAVEKALRPIPDERFKYRGGIELRFPSDGDYQSYPRWLVAKDEYQVRHGGKKRPFNIWLDQSGLIRRHLTPFQELTGTVPKKLAESLHLLEGQSPMALVVQKNTREALQTAVSTDLWAVDPKLPAVVEECIRSYHSSRAPFYPLSEVQRIGYVDENETLLCRRNGLPGFEAGRSYPITSETVKIGRLKAQTNYNGEKENLLITGQDLLIGITDGTGTVQRFMQFPDMELDAKGEIQSAPRPSTLNLQSLIDFFEIPEVSDIASLRQADYLALMERISALEERWGITLKNFQRDDLARSALMDGAILAWEAGLGKTWAEFIRPFLVGSRRVLLVVPDTLHAQTKKTARDFFGIEVRTLMSQDDFYNDPVLKKAWLAQANGEAAPEYTEEDPQFWITSYTALGMNGGDEWEPKFVNETLKTNRNIARKRESLPGWDESFSNGIGLENPAGIRCLLAPTLSRLVGDLFDCVEVDEGVRLKSTDSYISMGVRGLRPAQRLVLSATPIKNRLEDIFWLAHWVCGGNDLPTARWPYANESSAKEAFANEHQLRERNLTREDSYREKTGKDRKFEKRSAEICNIHRLWKLLGPIVIRRRKEDVGEDIAPKIFKPLRVCAGTAQQTVYGFHLQNPPEYSSEGEELAPSAVIAVQLSLLRQAALCPDSPKLRGYHSDPRRASWTDFTTKSAAILGALVECLGRGEQALIASPFQHFNATLYKRLLDSGVSVCLCDGTVSAVQRGKMAQKFKDFHYSVMVAGEKAMGEGNSFEQCTNLFMPSLDWAFDINDQTTDRIHRLNSRKPVHVYTCITQNTVDERLFSLYCEKGDSANLALDGRLFEERTEEVNLAKLLADAVRDFNPRAETIDEKQVEAEWPWLSQKLRIAEQQFREWHPPIVRSKHGGDIVTAGDIHAALLALADGPQSSRPSRPASSPVRAAGSRVNQTASSIFEEEEESNGALGAQIRALLDKINRSSLD